MACVTARTLRDGARSAMLACGGRGFVRFLPEGPALLVTDAVRRCADDSDRARLIAALEAAGFESCEQDNLLFLTPADDVLARIDGVQTGMNWESALHPAQALAARWQGERRRPLTDAGRHLVIETLRLTWQPAQKVLFGLAALRGQAAVMLRSGDRSGLHEAGALLARWCIEREGGDADED